MFDSRPGCHGSFGSTALSAKSFPSNGRQLEMRRREPSPREQPGSLERRPNQVVNPVTPFVFNNPAPRRLHSRRHSVSDKELQAQAWLDDRLAAFYRRDHGLWPRVRRLISGHSTHSPTRGKDF